MLGSKELAVASRPTKMQHVLLSYVYWVLEVAASPTMATDAALA